MSPDEFKEAMEKIAISDDCEIRHCHADDLLIHVLRERGYGDGCDIFEKMEKWFA